MATKTIIVDFNQQQDIQELLNNIDYYMQTLSLGVSSQHELHHRNKTIYIRKYDMNTISLMDMSDFCSMALVATPLNNFQISINVIGSGPNEKKMGFFSFLNPASYLFAALENAITDFKNNIYRAAKKNDRNPLVMSKTTLLNIYDATQVIDRYICGETAYENGQIVIQDTILFRQYQIQQHVFSHFHSSGRNLTLASVVVLAINNGGQYNDIYILPDSHLNYNDINNVFCTAIEKALTTIL